MTALIFDCDGVLSDTERYGHLPAFNQTFHEFGLPVQWTEAEYGRRLAIGGGKERMASLLTPAFVAEANLPTDPDAQMAEVQKWHKRKTAIYKAMVLDGKLPPRPGIARIIRAALADGWTLAVASTSAQESVDAILQCAVGPADAARFAAVFAGDIVAHKKPAPDIYNLAVERLSLNPAETIVVEDSRNGLRAAHAAGLACVVTVNGYTKEENMDEATMVVTDLGEPDHAMQVIANRGRAQPKGHVRLEDLKNCLPH